MMDYVRLQEDLGEALRSADALSNINIVVWRKWRIEGDIDFSLLWQTPRNGRSGAGILVEMPTFEVPNPNLPGPAAMLTFHIVIVEAPNLNFAPETGTLSSAEEIAQRVLETLHDYQIERYGQFYADVRAIEAADEFENLVAYRVNLKLRSEREPTNRVAAPAITESSGTITFTCATSGADIRYTLDDSFPGTANSAALRYTAAFTVASGTIVRWAAYKSGLLNSHVGRATIT